MKQRLLPKCSILSCVVLMAGVIPVFGQQTATASSQPNQPQPELKDSPTRVLQKFEPAENEEYALGPGDEISLDFPTRPELTSKRVVGPDGRLTLPLAGAIDLTNKTRAQAAQTILTALSPYYTDLTLTVSIDKYGSNRVVVIGNVVHPGVIYFDDTPTLLDVIARAGLMPTSSHTSAAPGSAPRDGIPDKCAIYRGNDQVMWINLRSMLESGSSMADLRLKRNDIVYVPAQQDVFVSVLGNVGHAGAIQLTPDSTLTSVLAQSGGLTDGHGSKIQVIQPSTGKTIFIAWKDLLTLKGNDEVQLHPGDVVYVPKSGFEKVSYVIQRISPVAAIGTLAAVAAP